MTDFAETGSFEYADRQIGQLLDKFKTKRGCPCCATRALLYQGANLFELARGSTEAVEVLEEMISALLENDKPAPDCSTAQH